MVVAEGNAEDVPGLEIDMAHIGWGSNLTSVAVVGVVAVRGRN